MEPTSRPTSTLPLLTCLGAGGGRPGITVFRIDADPWDRLPPCALPLGESVYAIAPMPNGEGFAAGTRSGNIRLFHPAEKSGGKFPHASVDLSHGAPVVTLCWTDASHLAVGDALGRCLLWDVDFLEAPPTALPKPEGIICSLLILDTGQLLGLSSGGELLRWSLPSGELLRTDYAPAPPSKNACVNLTWWESAGAVCYAARGGQLVLYDPDSSSVSALEAHEGNFFAVAEMGRQLVTAGYEEPCLRLWQPDSEKPCGAIRVPDGTLGLATLDPGRRMALRISQGGRAMIGVLGEDEFRVVSRVEGEDYRAVVGPSRKDLLEAEVVQVLWEAQQMLGQKRYEEMDRCVCQLRALGREEEALGLALQRSLAQNDPVEELRARLGLGELRADASPTELASLGRLWERLGWFEEALAFYQKIPTGHCNQEILDRAEILHRNIAAFQQGRHVIGPARETSLMDVLKAGNDLGRRFEGRWILAEGQEIPCPGVRLSLDELASKVEQVLDEEAALASSIGTLCWANADPIRETPTLILSGGDSELKHLDIAIHIESHEGGTVGHPFLLLHAGRVSGEESPVDHNQAVKRRYAALEESRAITEEWYSYAMGRALQAFKRLLNHKRAEEGPEPGFIWRI